MNRADRRGSGWLGEWGILCLLAVLALPLFTPRIYASDEIKYFVPLRSMYFDGDIHYENEYAYFVELDPVANADMVVFRDEVSPTGYRLNDAPIGSALLWTPFYIAADLAVGATRMMGSEIPRDGYSWPYIWAVALGSLFWGTMGLFITYRLCREFADSGSTSAALIGMWFASPVVFYLYVTPPMAHANSMFTVALFLFIWMHTRDERQLFEWGILGASAGLMVLVRELNWLLLLALVVDELAEMWDTYRTARVESALDSRGLFASWWQRHLPRLQGHVAFTGVMFVMVVPQFIVYRILHGTFTPAPYVVEKFSAYPIHAVSVLFSGFHGLFSWHPITLFGVVGLLALARQNGRIALALFVVFAAQVAVVGSYDTWWGGASFGARRFMNCTPIFVIGLAALLTGMRPLAHRIAVVGVGLLVVWNFGLAIQYGTGLIPRDEPVTMATIARNQVVEVVPRMFDVGWRFLVDRSSFYGVEP